MVTAMNFSRNKLETLPVGLFARLDKLLVIDLSYNLVQILSTEVGMHFVSNYTILNIIYLLSQLVETLKGLSVVNLQRNSLFAIDQVDIPNVLIEELDLSGNKLRFLKSKQFKSFSKL